MTDWQLWSRLFNSPHQISGFQFAFAVSFTEIPFPIINISIFSADITPASTACPPSFKEANRYYYGLPSRPHLVARSSANVWRPTGLVAYLMPKELHPLGSHPLQEIWEDTVSTAIISFLDSKGVQWTSLDPVRMGEVRDSAPPVIIWIGNLPGSPSVVDGINIAIHCRSILCSHNLDDIHVEIRESRVMQASKLYKPTSRFNPTANALMPLSTSLSLPISAQATPSIAIEGTGGFFVSDSCQPGKLFLVTARHIIFPPGQDSNEFYQYINSSQCRYNVLLMGNKYFYWTGLITSWRRFFFPLSVCIIKHHSSINTRFTVGPHSVVYHTGWRLRRALVLWYPDRRSPLYYRYHYSGKYHSHLLHRVTSEILLF